MSVSDAHKPFYCPNEEQFLRLIRDELKQGYGFVPLIGSGLSAPSGIPIVREFVPYLQRCVGMALGLIPDAPGTEGLRPWNPRTDRWPSFDLPSIDKPDNWFERLAELVREGGREHPHTHVEPAICQEAIGALAEWRSALMFLSRVQYDPRERLITLDAPNHEVIDTFFLRVTAGKGPTLGHRCLAMLADVLRFNILLTTNFDQLIEQAFREVSNPLTVFDIHLNARLPPYRVVQSQRSLVKLHGGRYGLRADYSLDGPPSEDDRHEFVSYLAGRPIGPSEWTRFHTNTPGKGAAGRRPRRIDAPRNHLLVFGLSTKDRRIRELIRFARDALASEESRVFWICHTESDREAVTRFFKGDPHDTQRKDDKLATSAPCVLCKHSFLGLLFLQAYQYFTMSLPPSGALFPSEARVAIPPIPPPESVPETLLCDQGTGIDERKPFLDAGPEGLGALLRRRLLEMEPLPHGRVLTLTSAPRVFGISSAAARLFTEEYERGSQCVWLDMDDLFGVDDLFEQLLEAVQQKAGEHQSLPVILQAAEPPPCPGGETNVIADEESIAELDRRDAEVRLAELSRYTLRSHRRWLIFLNAREGAGTSHRPPDELRFRFGPGNGWVDDYVPKNPTERNCCGKRFIALMRLLGRTPNVSVVFLCHVQNVLDPSRTCIVDDLRGESLGQIIKLNHSVEENYDYERISQKALRWAKKGRDRFRFLYAMVMLQRTRFPSILGSWAFHSHKLEVLSKDADRYQTAQNFLDDLLEKKVVRLKPGGFVWMHVSLRARLREELTNMLLADEDVTRDTRPAEIHHGLAEWYHKLYLCSHDPLAVFETIYHRCLSANHRLESKDEKTAAHEAERAVDSVREATRLLRAAQDHILAHGFSKSICRKLEFIRVVLLERCLPIERIEAAAESVRDRLTRARSELVYETIRLNREVALVVAESLTALRRHYQCLTYRTVTAAMERRSEWLDWQRVLGVIHLNHRSYDAAEKCFEEAYETTNFPRLGNSKSVDAFLSRVREWGDHPDREQADPGELPMLIKMLRRHVQVHYLQAEALIAAHRYHHQAGEPWMRKLETARFLYRAAEVLQQRLSSRRRDDYFPERERLLLHYALVLAAQRDFAQAHRRLNESASYSTATGGTPSSLGQALVDLARAAVHLREAMAEPCLRTARKQILSELSESALQSTRTFVDPLPNSAQMRQSLARLDDARRALTRASQHLDFAQKNVYWLTWSFQLKAKLIELLLFCRAGDMNGPVPALGPEYAADGIPTQMDTLLEDSGRLIRFDVFRHACVVESYVNATLALQIFANNQRADTALLARRHQDMAARCDQAAIELDRTLRTRSAADRYTEPGESGDVVSPLDRHVKMFAAEVTKHARRVAHLSRGWFEQS